MQLYTRLYDYINEYFNLVYKYYSKHALAFLVNYYSISSESSVWQTDNLYGGAYERAGSLSGMKYDKYMFMPVFFMEETGSIPLEGNEYGVTKETRTSMVFPSSYGITPYSGDYVKFEQSFLMNDLDNYPIYTVGGVEKATNTPITFWKANLYVEESRSLEEIEEHTSGSFIFIDYAKSFYSLEDGEKITKLMKKNDLLKEKLINNFYDPNSGFYLI